MLPVNEDNGDEIFRDAAGDYFLKIDHPAWDNLHPATNTGAHSSGNEQNVTITKRRFHLLQAIGAWLQKKTWRSSSWLLFNLYHFSMRAGKSKKKIDGGGAVIFAGTAGRLHAGLVLKTKRFFSSPFTT